MNPFETMTIDVKKTQHLVQYSLDRNKKEITQFDKSH